MSKHSPFTSEPSRPHSSQAEPREHVDIHHYGEDGKKDNSLTVPHVTDKDHVEYGRNIDAMRKQKK